MQPQNTSKKKFIPQLKIADMLSMVGVGLIGLGLGVSFKEHLMGLIPILIILGIILNGLGMYGKFEIEREHVDPPVWVIITFSICLMILMLTGLYILIGRYVTTIV